MKNLFSIEILNRKSQNLSKLWSFLVQTRKILHRRFFLSLLDGIYATNADDTYGKTSTPWKPPIFKESSTNPVKNHFLYGDCDRVLITLNIPKNIQFFCKNDKFCLALRGFAPKSR